MKRSAWFAALLAMLVVPLLGCQQQGPAWTTLTDLPGKIVQQTVTNAAREQRLQSMTPLEEADEAGRPGSLESWETARRDYPGALPGDSSSSPTNSSNDGLISR